MAKLLFGAIFGLSCREELAEVGFEFSCVFSSLATIASGQEMETHRTLYPPEPHLDVEKPTAKKGSLMWWSGDGRERATLTRVHTVNAMEDSKHQ
jgi:hypothetical protein